MKNNISLFIIGLFLSMNMFSQINTNHPTISKLVVSYKALPKLGDGANITVIPKTTINLVSLTNVLKVYLKILNTETNEIIYSINYPLDNTKVINDSGEVLFENVGNSLFISSGQSLLLKPYKYQIITEDTQHNLSPIYSVIQ